jgi:hypothetical protein
MTSSPITEHDAIAEELAVATTAATFQNLALIGALAEHRLVDPAKVANWAEFFALEMGNSAAADRANLEHLRKVAARLRDYAEQLVKIAEAQDLGQDAR